MTEHREQGRVSRRTITKGAAWAVPAVPLIVATPAYASSCEPVFEFSPDSCRCPGAGLNDKEYFIRICNTVECPDPDGVVYVSIRANTGPEPKEKFSEEAIAVPVGGCSEVITFGSDNSSVYIRFYYGATAEEANALDNPLYQVVAAPNDCGTLSSALGDCAQ